MGQTLSGRTALVTGAAGGIGAAAATTLAREGASVMLTDIVREEVGEIREAIVREGGRAECLAADLIEESAIEALVAKTIETFGAIDVVHNNAALQTVAQRAADRDVANQNIVNWDAAMAVNVRAPMLIAKHAVPHMIAKQRGVFIHSASGFGMQGEMTLTAYGASKAALINLSRFIATQYGKQGVRSNVIVIGFVLTPTALETTPQAVKGIILDHHMWPRLGVPQDIADVVRFLASDESSFINGAAIPVDGGYGCHQPSVADFTRLFATLGSNQL